MAQNDNTTNQVTSAAIALADNDSGTAMFDNVTSLMPGTPVVQLHRRHLHRHRGPDGREALRLRGAHRARSRPTSTSRCRSGADTAAAFRDCTGFTPTGSPVYTGTLSAFATAHAAYATGATTWNPAVSPRDPHLPLRPDGAGQHGGRGPDLDLWFLVGNAHQLTGAARASERFLEPQASPRKPWLRTVLYGAGTVSMLMISMASSLSLWIALPWAFLDWSPTLVTSGSMEPLVAPGDVVMIRPVCAEELVPELRGPLRPGRRHRARPAPHPRAASRRHLPHPG